MRVLTKLVGVVTFLLAACFLPKPVLSQPENVHPYKPNYPKPAPGIFIGPNDPLVVLNHTGSKGNPAIWFKQDNVVKAYVWWDQLNNRLNIGTVPNNPSISIGEDGSVVVIGTFGAHEGIVFPDGIVKSKSELKGPRGARGPQGIQGPRGPRGSQGPPGPEVKNTFAICRGESNKCIGVCVGGVLEASSKAPCAVTSDTGSCDWHGEEGECCVCSP